MARSDENSAPRLLVATVRARGVDHEDLTGSLRGAADAIASGVNDADPKSIGRIQGHHWWEYTITEGEPEPAAEPTAPDAGALSEALAALVGAVRSTQGRFPAKASEALAGPLQDAEAVLAGARDYRAAGFQALAEECSNWRRRAEVAEASEAELHALVEAVRTRADLREAEAASLRARMAGGERGDAWAAASAYRAAVHEHAAAILRLVLHRGTSPKARRKATVLVEEQVEAALTEQAAHTALLAALEGR